MTLNQIRCEAINVRTDSKVCPGLAKTEQGEVFVIDARTPASRGICCQAFGAMSGMKLAMMFTDKMEWEKEEHFDITCPHGVVTYRLSRIRA
jgi:uncharacterized repeat protein (TIGR04076 family)